MRFTLVFLFLAMQLYAAAPVNIVAVLQPTSKGKLLLALKPGSSIPDVRKAAAGLEILEDKIDKLVYTVPLDVQYSSCGVLTFFFIDNGLYKCTFESYLDNGNDSFKLQSDLKAAITESYS